jgi:hypothetical protein
MSFTCLLFTKESLKRLHLPGHDARLLLKSFKVLGVSLDLLLLLRDLADHLICLLL